MRPKFASENGMEGAGDGFSPIAVTVLSVSNLIPHSALLSTSTVDYRLMRNAAVAAARNGSLTRESVCYAHPELLRAAHSYSESTDEACPLCIDGVLVLVRYVFGPRLPSSGVCVLTVQDFDRIRRRKGNFSCYVVEVCAACGWNHLRIRFEFRGASTASSAAAGV